MERFVQFVVAGGLCLVAALWAAEFSAPGSLAGLAAAAVAAVGAAGVLAGVWLELDVGG
jgi:hypothetical protein